MFVMQPLNRRHFVASALAATGMFAPGFRARAAARPRKYAYIDIHVYVGRYFWGRELTVTGLLKLMDRNGVERACVLPLVSPEATIFPQTMC